MKRKILAAIGVLWGGAIVVSGLIRGAGDFESAFGIGQVFGLLLGIVMFSYGARVFYNDYVTKDKAPATENESDA